MLLFEQYEYCYYREEVQQRLKDANSTKQNRERYEWVALLAQAFFLLLIISSWIRVCRTANLSRDSQDRPDQAVIEDTGSWRGQVAGCFAPSLLRAQLGFKTAAEKVPRDESFSNHSRTRLGVDEYCNAILF